MSRRAPNRERKGRGSWADPQGSMKSAQPVVALDSDAIGRMLVNRLISSTEEQAARQFQSARTAYMQELPDVSQFKSCIAGGIPGYDDGEGDPAVIAAYRRIERLLSLQQRTAMIRLIDDGQVPKTTDDYWILRSGMQAIAGVDMRKKTMA